MHQLTILYNQPVSTEEFNKYYYDVHMPIASQMKNLKGWTIGKLEPFGDEDCAPFHMIVTMLADTREDLQAVLDSPEGKAAAADVPNFANGGVIFMWSEVEQII